MEGQPSTRRPRGAATAPVDWARAWPKAAGGPSLHITLRTGIDEHGTTKAWRQRSLPVKTNLAPSAASPFTGRSLSNRRMDHHHTVHRDLSPEAATDYIFQKIFVPKQGNCVTGRFRWVTSRLLANKIGASVDYVGHAVARQENVQILHPK